ncbi:hypothetical protein CPB85DRAFT_1298792 [Mucidula mucida]|nr:hypothetical protein CPB85DRAFT_1298792 [Mucidula mucida]
MTSSTSRADRDRSPSKKRRLPRACDLCKRKKGECSLVTYNACLIMFSSMRCLETPGNRCTNCVKSNAQCTHVENLGLAKEYIYPDLSSAMLKPWNGDPTS